MPSLRNILLLGLKEFQSLSHDSVMLLFILFAFTGAIYSAATGIPETLSHAPIAIVDEDRSQLSSQIVHAFQPPYFLKPGLISQNQMDQGLDSGRFTFTVDIPPNFQAEVLAGRRPEIQINVDATQITQAFSGLGYIQKIIDDEVHEFLAHSRSAEALPVELNVRIAFNPNLVQAWFGGVLELINNITMLSMILTGAALIREREHGTIEHLMVMPVTSLEIMISKIWSMGLVVQVTAMISLTVVIQGWLDTPVHGSIGLFFVAMTLHLFATTSMGIFLGTFAGSMPQFGLLSLLILIPLEMLSGGNTPMESMPVLVQRLMYLTPTSHFVSLAKSVLFRDAGLNEIWPDLLAITTIGVFFFTITLARFRRKIGLPA